ncbi:hypothetical protein [Phenylobacterium sp. J367]|uniref:hypothetical protein n=1 Tax=Phenylobacterium sp. J367 TaxID=2898435 RepID=UPI002150B296|nr:hypothetical protein [Phenylobacterium sp. J367]MCR5881085.1 hypothetical protein [Phenylobacterium sp. J367]
MRIMLCIAAVAALGAAPALAHEPAKAANAAALGRDAAQTTKSPRQVYVCDDSAMTKRGFAREFGSAEFVTAQQVVSGEAGTAPRCVTKAEARKLKQLASAR